VVTAEGLFGPALTYPDPDAQRRLSGLVGIDNIKTRLIREATTLLDPSELERWSQQHYGKVLPIVAEVKSRTSLIVLAGDVGTGKTELAESFADDIARNLEMQVTLYPLSLSARGKGAVGEMTTLLTGAFEVVSEAAKGCRDSNGKIRRGVMLLIDEADALAQSRDFAQMHHEDRAGVNALIRGIDAVRRQNLPVLTLMYTNRDAALDPAVIRRAAAILHFERPNEEQRREVIARALEGTRITSGDIDELVRLTGPHDERPCGCTYSDLRQRFIVEVMMDSLNVGPLHSERLIALAAEFNPTPPFGGAHD
jgi:SpoVK/Ycf46/Vps4 family AAA+-type ATPase